jgi:excinuclease ABC subunit B
MFVTPDVLQGAIWQIQDLVKQVDYFKEIGKHLEAKRLEERTNFDLEMIRELGYCSGLKIIPVIWMEDYGTRPFCVDYFPKDFLLVVDGHVTFSQVRPCMAVIEAEKKGGGFRLPAAMDNRPLKFDEFEAMQNQVIYVSTPADYELQKTEVLS